MKTFSDLQFKTKPNFGVYATINFENGYGASVIKNDFSYGGKMGLYELAVLDSDGEITYKTSITSNVIGYLSESAVSEILIKIQQL